MKDQGTQINTQDADQHSRVIGPVTAVTTTISLTTVDLLFFFFLRRHADGRRTDGQTDVYVSFPFSFLLSRRTTHSANILWRRVHARPRAHTHTRRYIRAGRRITSLRETPPLTSAGSPVAAGPRPRLPLHGDESGGEYPYLPSFPR